MARTCARWSGFARAGRRSGTSTHEAEAGALERRLGEVEGGPDGHGEVEFLEPGRRGGGVALGQGIERVRQPDETLGLVEERVVGRPVCLDDAVAERLEVALQVGQRGPQLVGRVGDEVPAHRLLALEAGRHLVERVGEAGELLRAVARDAGRVVAVGDPARGAAHLGDRAGEHAGHDDRQDDAHDGGDQDRGEDHGRDRFVVHRLGVVGRIAGLDHQRPEDLRADDGHADGQDQQPCARRDERRQGDPGGDPATDHGGAIR